MEVDMTAKKISSEPSRAACIFGIPDSSFLKIFSVTTIPSSTTNPVANTIASKVNTEDGVRIDIGQDWIHLRQSNTEPIIRIYAESNSIVVADNLAKKIINDIRQIQQELKEWIK